VSKKRVERLMRESGLKGSQKKQFCCSTDSRHSLPVAPNVLDRNFNPAGPNRAWAGDVTYIGTEEGWLYLAVILDLFSRRVVGWSVSPINDRHLALQALNHRIRITCTVRRVCGIVTLSTQPGEDHSARPTSALLSHYTRR
jgi:transposase InsO family protein